MKSIYRFSVLMVAGLFGGQGAALAEPRLPVSEPGTLPLTLLAFGGAVLIARFLKK